MILVIVSKGEAFLLITTSAAATAAKNSPIDILDDRMGDNVDRRADDRRRGDRLAASSERPSNSTSASSSITPGSHLRRKWVVNVRMRGAVVHAVVHAAHRPLAGALEDRRLARAEGAHEGVVEGLAKADGHDRVEDGINGRREVVGDAGDVGQRVEGDLLVGGGVLHVDGHQPLRVKGRKADEEGDYDGSEHLDHLSSLAETVAAAVATATSTTAA